MLLVLTVGKYYFLKKIVVPLINFFVISEFRARAQMYAHSQTH